MGGSVRRCRWYDCEQRVPDTVRYCDTHFRERAFAVSRARRERVGQVQPKHSKRTGNSASGEYDYRLAVTRPGYCSWVEKERIKGWRLRFVGGEGDEPRCFWYECPSRIGGGSESFCAAHAAQAKATADALATSPAMLAVTDRVCAALDGMAGPFRDHLCLKQMAREIDDDPTEPTLGKGA